MQCLSKKLDRCDRCSFRLSYVCSGCPSTTTNNRRYKLPLNNTNTTVQAIPGEIYIGAFEGKGIFRSTHESKWADNNTYYQVGVVKAAGGKWSWTGYSKNLRTDGDMVLWEFSGDSENGSTSKVIYGTGKFKGAKGEMTTKQITAGKPVVEGTTQSCQTAVGWIELVK